MYARRSRPPPHCSSFVKAPTKPPQPLVIGTVLRLKGSISPCLAGSHEATERRSGNAARVSRQASVQPYSRCAMGGRILRTILGSVDSRWNLVDEKGFEPSASSLRTMYIQSKA